MSVKSVVVNGDHSALNLSLVATGNRPSPSNHRSVVDEQPEVTRRRKAELMTSLRLADTSGFCVDSPTPEVETSTDWNGNHLLHEPTPPPCKRQRTDVDEEVEEREKPEAEVEPETEEEPEEVAKKGRSSLFSVLAVCSFTDIYNSYRRREARRRVPEVRASAGNEADSETGSGLTAEAADLDAVETAPDRKSTTPTWDGAVVRAEGELTDEAPPGENGVYPLAARCVSASYYISRES